MGLYAILVYSNIFESDMLLTTTALIALQTQGAHLYACPQDSYK